MKNVKVDNKIAGELLGANDRNLTIVGDRFGCSVKYNKITAQIEVSGKEEEKVARVLEEMKKAAFEDGLTDVEILSIMSLAQDDALNKRSTLKERHLVRSASGNTITPLTMNQNRAVDAFENANTIFLEGEAGTGKTMVALAWALGKLFEKQVDKIYICKPTVTVGDEVGFLPGTLNEKTRPTEASFDDKLNDLVGLQKAAELEKAGRIVRVPLTSIRGRSFDSDREVFIVDETQNCTEDVIKAIATRQGKAKFIFCGDGTQSDLNRRRKDEYIKKNDSTYTKFVKFLDVTKKLVNGEKVDNLGYSEKELAFIKAQIAKNGTMIKALKMNTIEAVYFEKKDILRSFEVCQLLELFDNYDFLMDFTHAKAEGLEEAEKLDKKLEVKRNK